MTRYKFKTRVKRIERRERILRAWKEGDEVKTKTEDQGWFVVLEGSWEALFFGTEKPDLIEGQPMLVTIEPDTER